MNRLLKILIVVALLMVSRNLLCAQEIGGKWEPLLNSVHTYSILMGNENYTPNWGLYPDGTLASSIEDGTADATALEPGVDYTVVFIPANELIVEGYSFWKIQFNRNITENTTYVIGYKESTADENKCLTAVVHDVVVQPPFDVDMLINDTEFLLDCSDNDNQFKTQLELDAGIQTNTVFKVFIEHPTNYVLNGAMWSFQLEITVTGQGGGTNATIASVTVTDIDPVNVGAVNLGSWNPGTSQFTSPNVNIAPDSDPDPDVTRTPVFVDVTYNEVLGVSQDIKVEIISILGAYDERDTDEVNNTQTGNNIVNHTIYGLPNVSGIEPMN